MWSTDIEAKPSDLHVIDPVDFIVCRAQEQEAVRASLAASSLCDRQVFTMSQARQRVIDMLGLQERVFLLAPSPA